MNHKFWNAGGGKPEDVTHVVKNAENVTIRAGVPVVYAFNGTDDGLAVVLPSSSTATNVTQLTAGLVVKDISPGKLGEVQVYGFFRKGLIARATRAATNGNWGSMASLNLGSALGIDTTLNGLGSAAGVSIADMAVVLAENIASLPSLPSSAGSGTIYYQPAKVFLRFM